MEFSNYLLLESDSTLDPSDLEHINEFYTADDEGQVSEENQTHLAFRPPHRSHVILGAGLAPVPSKLVQRIQRGDFIEMSELLPERLAVDPTSGDSAGSKSKKKLVTSILEWVQCFGLYTAIISKNHPERVPDLLAYQSLIIDAHREYKGDYWSGYDRRFRQRAAATQSIQWASIDSTLWSMAFASRGTASRCKFCFSTCHNSDNCELNCDNQSSSSSLRSSHPSAHREYASRRCICYEWNETPSPNCSRPKCAYEHICYLCYRDPDVTSKYHKALQCSRWKPGVLQRPSVGK